MAIALTVDVMKTTTLAFVAPGMAQEYGLRSPLNPTGVMSVTYLPLSGITGTVIGSFIAGSHRFDSVHSLKNTTQRTRTILSGVTIHGAISP